MSFSSIIVFLLAGVCTRSYAHDLMADYSFPCYFLTEPSAPPSNVTGRSASSTSIFVSWGQVLFLDQNGVILSYTVTYRALPSGSSQTKNVSASVNQTTLTDLNEFTNYSITVFASTSKGGGIQSTAIVVITDEDSKFGSGVFLFGCFFFLSLQIKTMLAPHDRYSSCSNHRSFETFKLKNGYLLCDALRLLALWPFHLFVGRYTSQCGTSIIFCFGS